MWYENGLKEIDCSSVNRLEQGQDRMPWNSVVSLGRWTCEREVVNVNWTELTEPVCSGRLPSCGCVQQCVLSTFRSSTEALSFPIWTAITATHWWGFPVLPLSACGTSCPSPHLSSAWTVVAFSAAHAGNSTATPGFPHRAPPEVVFGYMVMPFHPNSWSWWS